MKIPAQQLADVIHEEDDSGEWELVEDEITGRWRWGINKRAILRHSETETLWGIYYQVETSNEDYRLYFLDEIEVELWKAKAVSVQKTEYRKEIGTDGN